jgi:hypothetical protein
MSDVSETISVSVVRTDVMKVEGDDIELFSLF